jgi:ribosome-binding factor A
MKRGHDRTQRVGDLIQKALAQLLQQEMGDARFRLVTVTGAHVARDLSFAKIDVSVLSDDAEQIKHTVAALNQAAKFLRSRLAQRVKLRIVPELKFVYDGSTVYGMRLSNLIDSAIKKSEKDQ